MIVLREEEMKMTYILRFYHIALKVFQFMYFLGIKRQSLLFDLHRRFDHYDLSFIQLRCLKLIKM